MTTARVIKAVLGNFLGTYVSWYSDYQGYWLFGFLVGNFNNLKVDLLKENFLGDPHSELGMATLSALSKFEDQRRKAGLVPSQIRRACLTIHRNPESESGSINGHSCEGFGVRFSAEASMDNGRKYKRERVVFVAPHDPKIELCSTRTPAKANPSA
jgi:hypothetical protein